VIRYQTISKFSIESGYTEWAIRGKIRDGVWLEGRVWVKAPDGRILISIEGYNPGQKRVWRPRHQWKLDRNHLRVSRGPMS
jgi:hypothetical protein